MNDHGNPFLLVKSPTVCWLHPPFHPPKRTRKSITPRPHLDVPRVFGRPNHDPGSFICFDADAMQTGVFGPQFQVKQ